MGKMEKKERITTRQDLNIFLKGFGQSINNFCEDEVEMLFESEDSLVLAQRKGLDLQKYIIPSKESLVELEARLSLLAEDALGKFHIVHGIIGGDEFALFSYDDQEEAVSEARDLVVTNFKKIKSGKEFIEIRFDEINDFNIHSCTYSGYNDLDYGQTMIGKARYWNDLYKLWAIYDSNTLLDLKNVTDKDFDKMTDFEEAFYQNICEEIGIAWGYENNLETDKWQNTDDMWEDIEKMMKKRNIDLGKCELKKKEIIGSCNELEVTL